jgi:uncharacterized membrane protein
MRRIIVAVAVAAGLTSCGDEGGQAENNVRSIQVTGEYEKQLKALSEPNRNLGLRRAIMQSRQRCKRVEASGYQEAYSNMSMWTARCSDTGDWALFIAANGDVQVRKCTDAKALGLPECRSPAPLISETKG